MINTSKDIDNSQNKAIGFISDQHADKLSSGDKKVLELLDWQSLVSLSLANKSFERIRKLVSYRKPKIVKHIDLRLFTNLQKCLAPSFKEELFVKEAMQLVKQVYESDAREIRDVKYGFTYPMVPELMHYAMFLANNQTVLEIAGARGENSALLAFSGAKRVYMNDICSEEVDSFKNLVLKLPLQVQEKIEPILGNCFELLNLNLKLKGTVGLLLCYNLLHFFDYKKLESFLKLLKTILMPGGRAILTANACFALRNREHQKTFEERPEHTSYGAIHCFLHDYLKGQYPITELFHSVSRLAPECEFTSFTNTEDYYLWLKNKNTQFNWVKDDSGYKALPQQTADRLKNVVEKNLNFIKTLHHASVRLVIQPTQFFRKESFANLFIKAGFEVEQTFLIKENGHLFFGENPYNGATKVGIIIKAP